MKNLTSKKEIKWRITHNAMAVWSEKTVYSTIDTPPGVTGCQKT